MNVEAVRWAFRQHTGDARAKLLLCTIASAVGDDGTCSASVRRLAVGCELSVRMVLRQLHRLEELGLLEKRPGPPANDGSGQGRYEFRIRGEVER